MLSKQQAQYFAYELTRLDKDSNLGSISQALMDAQVDLNPHQIDAASFAIHSPLSKGSILADEVGLGKTIEAGIVLCQYWSERKRHLIIVCPASLRGQWKFELEEKFNLNSIIIDSTNYYPGIFNLEDKVIIVSYNYGAKRSEELTKIPWDLCVFDEVHKLRNCYKENNKTGQALIFATKGRKKLLLTATPLQNSLMELYGLSYFIDDSIFGDDRSFRAQYSTTKSSIDSLKKRLETYCKRTLRSQVTEYIQYTKRKPITFPFEPSNAEIDLSQAISSFLQKETLYALPPKQKHLTSLILYKLLSSSSSAVLGTLETMKARLLKIQEGLDTSEEDEALTDIVEEANFQDEIDEEIDLDENDEIDTNKLQTEINEISHFINLAQSVRVDKKTDELLKALAVGFKEMQKSHAPEKALIFTESRRTQKYLFNYLSDHGYKDKIVLFYGGNRLHRDNLLEQFKNDASIMIATEAGAEGLNMQFCSLLINYDLPWNPQRVEQRIGRCHRYGQKHDVVVINFVNIKNPADQRVFELLNEKFKLFEGVFGASDEILGSIEDGVDFENKILKIYQTCRTEAEIQRAFDELQDSMKDLIQEKMLATKKKLLSEFDAVVAERLNVTLEGTKHLLNERQMMFWRLSKAILHNDGEFNDEELSFTLKNAALGKPQKYYFITSKDKHIDLDNNLILRLNHPLGQFVIDTAKKEQIGNIDEITFDVSNDPLKHTYLQEMSKDHVWGYCSVDLLTIDSFEKEEYIVCSGIDNYGKKIDSDALKEMLRLEAYSIKQENIQSIEENGLDKVQAENIENTKLQSQNRNNEFFITESEKIEKFAEDKLYLVEKELKDVKDKIKSLTREERNADTLDRKTIIQEEIARLEKKKRRLRQNIFDAEDEIEKERDDLISALKAQMDAKINQKHLFTFKWKLQ